MTFKRIETGIPGLDDLIEGGIPENFIILVSGPSGTGKTTFSLQFLVEGIQKYNQKGMYIGLGEDIEIIQKSMESFGMDLKKLGEKNDLVFADIPALELEEVEILLDGVSEDVERLVIDPMSALLFKYEDMELRQKIRELIELIRSKNITALITTELPENSKGISRFGIEDFLSDGIIVLYYLKDKSKRYRGLEVRKLRGTNHSSDIHLYKITRNKGIEVFKNRINLD
ncbi:MAG: ATPase domain-containing protein [Promethearchaeia archaeon]